MTATTARGIPGPRMLRAVISAECKSVFAKNPRIGSPFRRSHEMLGLNSHECGQPDRSARLRPAAQYAPLFALPVLVPAMLHVRGVYRRRVRIALRALSPMLGAISVAAMAVLTFDVVIFGGSNVAPLIGWIWILTIFLLAGGRCALALARRQARIKGLAGKPTLIVGAGVVGTTIAQRLAAQPEYGLHPVGFLDEDPPAHRSG